MGAKFEAIKHATSTGIMWHCENNLEQGSRIQEIPIGKPTSKKYHYGTGNYIIIDVSWYAPYKQLGDKIILAIAWALFLWHMFLKLPGIISGTEGSIVSMDKSYQRYEIVQKSKKR